MIYALFFISGVSGLIFEIIWVRQFGNMFGNTVYSAAIVTAVFMCGLGVGGLLLGLWSDKKFSIDSKGLVKLYAYFEIAIGVIGFLYALLFTKLEFLSPYISSYIVGPEGWFQLSTNSYLLRYFMAVVMLAPITLLMGGTLTILIRFLVAKDLNKAGWKIGVLYAVNTAGASVGCFSVDSFLIPSFGLLGTQTIAAAFNLLAGLGALRLYASLSSLPSTASHATPEIKPAPGPVSAVSNPTVIIIACAVFLCGFAGMGMEIVWFRFLSNILGTLRSTFSMMLTVILIGIWLGSITGGYCSRKFGRPTQFLIIFQCLFAASTIVMFLFFNPHITNATQLIAFYEPASATVKTLLENWLNIRPILLLVGLPTFFMGAAYPLANAIIQNTKDSVGKKAGMLYLSNTIGAVLGSTVAAFVLLTNFGMQNSVLILTIFSLAAIILLYISFVSSNHEGALLKRFHIVTATSLVVLAVCMIAWSAKPADYILKKIYSDKKTSGEVTYMSEGVADTIAIVEDKKKSPNGKPSRTLFVDGVLMSGTSNFPQRYMRAFSHIPLLHIEEPKHVLVICFGVGNTAHAASLHPDIEKIDVVDLSKHVLKQAHYFSQWNHTILQDPRVSVYVNDGRQHLRMQKEDTYDLITSEPPPMTAAGVSSLYSKEYYQLVLSRLKDGGFCSQWFPAYQVSSDVAKSMVKAFIDVFPNSIMISGNRDQLILLGRKNKKIHIDPLLVQTRLQANQSVHNDLRKYYMGSVTEIIGTYVASYATMSKAVVNVAPTTDDYPIMEYVSRTPFFHETIIPIDFFNVDDVDEWCPDCYEDGVPVENVKNLSHYLMLLNRWYHSLNFLYYSSLRNKPNYTIGTSISGNSKNWETYINSPYLRKIFPRQRFNPPAHKRTNTSQ